MSNYFGTKKGNKKIMVLVRCSKCQSAFYINQDFLNLNFQGKPVPQQCRICGRQVNLIRE